VPVNAQFMVWSVKPRDWHNDRSASYAVNSNRKHHGVVWHVNHRH